MPGSYLYPDERARFVYISDVLDTLVLRDVRQKYRIRNAEQLKRTCEFLMDNVGNISSLKSMAATLSQAGLKMNDKTLAAYIDHLCDAFAFYRVRRFDVAGKNISRRATSTIWPTIHFVMRSSEPAGSTSGASTRTWSRSS